MRIREALLWGVGITAVWILVIVVIVAAAGGAEPSIEAGSVVTVFAVALFAGGAAAGFIGRERPWPLWFVTGVAISITVAIAVAVTIRGEFAQVVWAPMVGVFTGAIGALLAMFGWLVGGVGRSLLGRDERDEGIL